MKITVNNIKVELKEKNDDKVYSKDDAYKTLDITNMWIENVDSKISYALAFIGILIFPACIYHIFFSYRGVTSISNEYSVIDYFKLLANAFSLNFVILCIILIIGD